MPHVAKNLHEDKIRKSLGLKKQTRKEGEFNENLETPWKLVESPTKGYLL